MIVEAPEIIATSDAAQILGVSYGAFMKIVERGNLQPAYRTAGRHMLFRRSDIEALKEVRRKKAQAGGVHGKQQARAARVPAEAENKRAT